MYYKVAPSVLAADFTDLGNQLRAVSEAGAEWIHLDVMDGAFVPSISFGMPVIKSIRRVTDGVFDVHMMVEEPGRYVEDIKECGGRCNHRSCRGLQASGPCGKPDQGSRLPGRCGFKSCHPYFRTGYDFGSAGYGSYHDRKSRLWRPEVYPIYA